MTSGSLLLLYFSCLCICLINASEDNATQVKAVKNCNVTKSIAFLRGLSGILFSDKSDDKLDYYFSVCGFKTYGNTSMFINQTVISVGDDEISEIGSFANFSLSYKSDGYVLLFNDSVNAAKLVLGCGSLPAFHRVSNEGEEYYVFNLFHPSLCGIRESVMYTLIVVIIWYVLMFLFYKLIHYGHQEMSYKKYHSFCELWNFVCAPKTKKVVVLRVKL
uniref:Uncharacterized protein n=1 Tax=Trichobilharzia regenti TaxID=157069 RepID=A0AA85K110_TRIRE|nr:unnamed protein product [Trichobilharzia regenti]